MCARRKAADTLVEAVDEELMLPLTSAHYICESRCPRQREARGPLQSSYPIAE